MTVVRELITLLSYKKGDEAPLNDYGSALKQLAAWAAALFSAHEIMGMADEWASVSARVLNVTENVGEQHKALAALREQADRTGISIGAMGDLFVGLEQGKDLLGYTTDEVLKLSDAISKTIVAGGGTPAQMAGSMEQIRAIMAMNVLTRRQLNAIPSLLPILAKAEGGMANLLAKVHGGKFTGKMMADDLMREMPEIEWRFNNMIMMFSTAFGKVRNVISGLIIEMGDATGVWSYLANLIVIGAAKAKDGIHWLVKEVGGWGNALRLIEIVLVAVLGPPVISGIIALVSWIGTITAAWALVAAGIVAVGLAIDDIYNWWMGRPSLLGDLIGNRSEWEPQIAEFKAGLDAAWEATKPLRDTVAQIFSSFKEIVGMLDEIRVKAGIPMEWVMFGPLLVAVGILKTIVSALDTIREKAGIPLEWIMFGPLLAAMKTIKTTLDALKAVGNFAGLGEAPAGGEPAPPALGPGGRLRHWLFDWPGANAGLGSIPPSAMTPQLTSTSNTSVGGITVNVTSLSDTPAAIGNAAGIGARQGLLSLTGYNLGITTPRAEFGLDY